MSPKERHTLLIKQEAERLGFEYCRVAKADFLEEEAPRLEKWLNEGHHGEMSYMENHFDKRLDPRLLVDDAKSVICLLYNYHNPDKQTDPEAPKISQYAYGRDYHKVIKKKLKLLHQFITEEIGEVHARGFVDSAPVLEKAWAQRSGLGWVGKHSNLITKQQGSYMFTCELIVDLDLIPDEPFRFDHCGTCTRCIDACPTGAIIAPYVVDGSKCISYYTIELNGALPEEAKLDGWMFGCDECQEVCPWNRFSKRHEEPDFEPRGDLLEMTMDAWAQLDEEKFELLFTGSAVKRTGLEGLQRNIRENRH